MRNDQPNSVKNERGDRGLTCRHCGGRRLRVVYTRARLGGTQVRRRECRKCGKRFTTWEKAIGFGNQV
jgi:transcriptional regulator NrdR family protein